MTKLLATLIAAVFFSVSMGSVAIAAAPESGAPKAEAKKKDKAKKPAKAKKSAKAKKPAKK